MSTLVTPAPAQESTAPTSAARIWLRWQSAWPGTPGCPLDERYTFRDRELQALVATHIAE